MLTNQTICCSPSRVIGSFYIIFASFLRSENHKKLNIKFFYLDKLCLLSNLTAESTKYAYESVHLLRNNDLICCYINHK